MLRVNEGHGNQPYYQAVVAANGSIKPSYALIRGKPVCRQDGVYYLRYRDKTGKRHYQFAGTDPKQVRVMQLQRQHVIAGEEMGLPAVDPPPAARPKKVLALEPPSVAPLVNPQAPPADASSNRLAMAPTVDKFVREMTAIRSRGRAYGCRLQLGLFLKTFKKAYLDEIDDDDVIAYVAKLRERNLSLRTIANYCATLNAFLRRYDYKDRVKKRFVPKPTEKKVCAYSAADLKAIFKSATPEEEILFRFFLGIGMREREVMFAAWRDLEFERGLFHVTEKLDAGFTIKDKEERLIPIPSGLLEQLKRRYQKRTHERGYGCPAARSQQERLAVCPDSTECSDPKCYAAKVDAHVRQTVAAKPKLVQISTANGTPKDGSAVVPRNKYVEIRNYKPTNQKQRDWPEYKPCKFTTEAIVTQGSEKGELRRVCANPECLIHHAKKPRPNVAADAGVKAEQEKRRREEALAPATGLRVLSAIVEAVPVRLMKGDLLFVVEHLAAMLDKRRVAIVLRQHGIGKAKCPSDTPAKLLAAFLRKSEESVLGRLLVEIVILRSANSVNVSDKLLKDAAEFYKVDVNVITAKVKPEFAAKDKAKTTKQATPKPPAKVVKKTTAA
jgi:hypothetical protein